jgi:hypothetical protein
MLRYLQEAFWARPDHGTLRMPWNAVAVMLAFGFGFQDSRVWIAGGVIEVFYLIAMATSRRFRARVDGSRSQEDPSSDDALFHSLGTPARLRYKVLDEKCRSIESIYDASEAAELIHENNRDALRRLRTLYLRLLVARRNLMLLGSTDEETRLRAQIAELERDLAMDEEEDDDIQQSREETLVALEERLGNFERRDASLCSIDTDLTHIDARVDLALQNASLDATPTAISTNIRLTSEAMQDGSSGDQR